MEDAFEFKRCTLPVEDVLLAALRAFPTRSSIQVDTPEGPAFLVMSFPKYWRALPRSPVNETLFRLWGVSPGTWPAYGVGLRLYEMALHCARLTRKAP